MSLLRSRRAASRSNISNQNYTSIEIKTRYLPNTGLIPDQMEIKRCWYCHLIGHCENVCRKRIANRHPQTEPHLRGITWCHYCRIPGHDEPACRKKKFNQSQPNRNKLLGLNPSPGILGPAPARPAWTLFRESANSHPTEQLAALIKSLN